MTQSDGGLLRHFRLRSATALVIANIIGAGIFTSTGFQVEALGHAGYIYLLWIVGGVLAFCGAVCYAELGAAMPEAGAEYVYLRETFGPALGFMTAFVSLTAGFSAPIASACKSFVRYLFALNPDWDAAAAIGPILVEDIGAIAIVWALVIVHMRGARGGTLFNDLVTLFKVTGIALIILAAFTIGRGSAENLAAVSPSYGELSTGQLGAAFGTSLIFVGFCYSGWNAAAYVAGEMRNPERDLPRALMLGTALVVVLYLGLNAVYFYGASLDELSGKVEVGLIAGRNLFGDTGAVLVTLVLCVSIFASASAMTVAGPRVYYAFGRDFPPLKMLAAVSPKTGAPIAAIVLQGAVTSIVILSGRVDQIQQYAGFTLTLFGSLAVLCVIVLRIRKPEMPRPFRAWGYPVTPLLFLGLAVWTMIWAIRGRPIESMLSLATVVAGGLLFYALRPRGPAATRSIND